MGPDQQHSASAYLSCKYAARLLGICFRYMYTDHDSSSNSYMAVQSNLCHSCYAMETEEN